MSELDEIKTFTIAFFTNLKANLFWDNNNTKLTITSVPDSFEKFYGKKAPYELVFNQIDVKNQEEPMIRGSFLLNCMKEYLGDKGKATLVKLDLNFEPKEEIKSYFKLKNAIFENATKKISYDSILRFTFLTTLQYLNEREQVMNQVHVKENEIINFDLDKYLFIDGKKEEITLPDIKNQYNLAKEYLKLVIHPKIDKISESLGIKLEKEIGRVKQHYIHQIDEDSQNLEKSQKQIKELENQLSSDLTKTIDKDFIEIKIKRMKETIESLKSEKRKTELTKEEDFFIHDETNKHSLGVDNKLMNTTIIYFPIYSCSGYLKNHDANRVFNFTFNPLTKEISKVNCEICSKEIKDISLCTGGHISCGGCLRACLGCQNEYCTKCLQISCFSCGKKLCKKCAKKCSSCGKYKCEGHMSSSSVCQTCMEKKKLSSFSLSSHIPASSVKFKFR